MIEYLKTFFDQYFQPPTQKDNVYSDAAIIEYQAFLRGFVEIAEKLNLLMKESFFQVQLKGTQHCEPDY